MKRDYSKAYRDLKSSYLITFILSSVMTLGLAWILLKFFIGDVEPFFTTLIAVITGIVTSLFYERIVTVIQDGTGFVLLIEKKILILNDIRVNLNKIKETVNFIVNSKSNENGIFLLFNSIQECKVSFTKDELFDSISITAILSLMDVFNEKLIKMRNKEDIIANKEELLNILDSLVSVVLENIRSLETEKNEFMKEKDRLEKVLEGKRD